jgi:hypothetical protein
MRAVLVAAVFVSVSGPALAEMLTCSTWQGVHTCADAHGYVSHETQWQGMIIRDDNRSKQVDNVELAGDRHDYGDAAAARLQMKSRLPQPTPSRPVLGQTRGSRSGSGATRSGGRGQLFDRRRRSPAVLSIDPR